MARRSSKTIVALVGRPNVGKSTMFNVLVGGRRAIVEDTPGLTRDRNYAEASIRDRSFIVVDTGGFEPSTDDVILSQMRTQTMVAIEQADIIVFLGDARLGLTPSDYEIVRTLERTDKRVFYTANKVDSERLEDHVADFYALGVDTVYPVSAMTGYGMGDFLDALVEEIPPEPEQSALDEILTESRVKVAVVGRPNVGKSTLINLLLGEERLVANPVPGTTRDSIDTVVKSHGKEYVFIDTAGIRRRSRIVDRVERYSVIKAFAAVDRADIVLVLMDATEPATEQDARIVGYAFERGRGLILILNKWDLVAKDSVTHDKYVQMMRDTLKYVDHAPILTISALKGKRVPKIFETIQSLDERYRKRVPTAELNRFLERVLEQHPPGMHRGNKRVKIYYMTQVRTAPPSFTFFSNYPESIHFSYRRFLENRLREEFDFDGSPIKLYFKKRKGRDDEQSGRDRNRKRR